MNQPACHYQSQLQTTKDQQPYMADSDSWVDEESGRSSNRKMKRLVPDTEKDDRYWEKRKRNNMAAKRSRENKRQQENDVKQKVALLEEQNALLRKEIILIKARYGIPPDQSLLTPGEREQCMLEVRAAQVEARRRKESAGSADDVSSTSPSLYPVSLNSSTDDCDMDRRLSSEPPLSSPKVKTNSLDLPYGPSAYGPFTPSPSWAPSVQCYTGNNSAQSFSPPAGHQGKSVGGPGQEKYNPSYPLYGGMATRPYDFYMQYANYGAAQMSQGEGHYAAPADLSTNRKKQGGAKVQYGGGARNMKNTGHEDHVLNHSPAHVLNHSPAYSSLFMDAAMAYSLGHVTRHHEGRMPSTPAHMNSSSNVNKEPRDGVGEENLKTVVRG
ncbi:uncharacterized protein LOC131937227 [Physella acuta]|uniref:uncharacterized protein LOC131937227 n=1 Tax=Physella acuta TaxID=109671 RepID=UPI0027DE2350|nr:uncharacterized protein LOC131937227 [Physella acuta]